MRMVFVAALLAVLVQVAGAAEISDERIEALEAWLEEEVASPRLDGIVAVVAVDGRTKLYAALGQRDAEANLPMTRDTIFRIFSMTKPVTGTALMMLYDEGKFALDDPVHKYIPAFEGLRVLKQVTDDGEFVTEPAREPMTIRQLMTHTGGLLYTPPLSRGPLAAAYGEAGVLDADSSLAAMAQKLGKLPLGYQPGTQWVYSVSVDVQGYLVEVLSGQPFDVFLEERLFKPLGMNDTGFHVQASKVERLASLSTARGKMPTEAALKKPGLPSGGGGLYSTADDYLRFCRMHLNGGELDGVRILSEEAARLMHVNQLPAGVDAIGRGYPGNVFGLDFAVVNDSEAAGGPSEGSYWWWGIGGTWFWVDPERDLIFIGMIQNMNVPYARQLQARSRELLYR